MSCFVATFSPLLIFTVPLQRKVIVRMLERLRPNGYFVIGADEQLPGDVSRLIPLIGEAGYLAAESSAAIAIAFELAFLRRNRR